MEVEMELEVDEEEEKEIKRKREDKKSHQYPSQVIQRKKPAPGFQPSGPTCCDGRWWMVDGGWWLVDGGWWMVDGRQKCVSNFALFFFS